MTDAEIVAYFQDRGFTVLDTPTRSRDPDPALGTIPPISLLQEKLRASRRGARARMSPTNTMPQEDLVTLRIQPQQQPDDQQPFTVVVSRSLGRVVGEQD